MCLNVLLEKVIIIISRKREKKFFSEYSAAKGLNSGLCSRSAFYFAWIQSTIVYKENLAGSIGNCSIEISNGADISRIINRFICDGWRINVWICFEWCHRAKITERRLDNLNRFRRPLRLIKSYNNQSDNDIALLCSFKRCI